VKNNYLSALVVGAVSALLAFSGGIQTATASNNSDTPRFTTVQQLTRSGARLGQHKRTGKINFLGFNKDRELTVPGMFAGATPDSNARAALANYATLFGVTNPSADLRQSGQFTSTDGRSTVRYQQQYQGIPIIGGELIVNIDNRGQLTSMNGEALPDAFIDTEATVTASDATSRALSAVASYHNVSTTSLASSDPELSIYAPGLIGPDNRMPMLVWKLEIFSDTSVPINEFVLVHATRGHIELHFNQVHTVKNRSTHDGTFVILEEQLPGILLCNEADGDACTSGAVPDADAAHIHAGDTYDFYLSNNGRDSIDGSGMMLTSTVRFSCVNNAFWYSPKNQMIYCPGMPQGDDVVAHELTHGVTDRTSKLYYYYQSGAINESLSDIWGEFVDQTNGRGDDSAGVKWLLGEDTPLGTIRSMANPPLYNDPDMMSSVNYHVDATDSGGVHVNSGINNKAAYLMVDGSAGEAGGLFNGRTISAMGIPKVSKIYYEAQTRLLTSGSDYLDLHNALFQGCLNLVGTDSITNADCDNVREATLAVEMDQDPASFNPEAALCPAGQAPSNLFFDDFERGTGRWNFGGAGGSDFSVWSQDAAWAGQYTTSGSHSLYANDNVALNHTYASMIGGITIPTGGLKLHFKHAFDLATSGDGGARLFYSINGGAFQDAGPLFVEGQDYSGLINTGAASGSNGFVDASHGYISSGYEITTNEGDSIRFRFDLATGNNQRLGWWIDDVRLYTCVPNTAPTAPALIGPADAASDVDSTLVQFSWDPSTDVDGDTVNYNLEVCTDPGFNTCAVDITKGNSGASFVGASIGGGMSLALIGLLVAGRHRRLSAVILVCVASSLVASCGGGSSSGPPPSIVFNTTTLSPGTTYYWRVTANDGNGGLTPSAEWIFTTLP
jgi:bacillolysin